MLVRRFPSIRYRFVFSASLSLPLSVRPVIADYCTVRVSGSDMSFPFYQQLRMNGTAVSSDNVVHWIERVNEI